MKTLKSYFLRSNIDTTILRLGLIILFAVFGLYKWFDFEIQILTTLTHGTWLGLLYTQLGPHDATFILAIIENVTLAALILGFFNAQIGLVGDSLVLLTGLVTLSLLPQLGRLDSFILKDVLLIGAGLVLLKTDLRRLKTTRLCGLA